MGLLGICLVLLGCANIIGSLEGLVIADGQSANVNVKFSAINFPTSSGQDVLNIRLSNVSDDEVTLSLSPKNPDGVTLTARFSIGQYVIDGTNNQFSGSILFVGSSKADIVGTGGFFNLTSLQLSQAAAGSAAISVVAGNFSVDLQGGGSVTGDFEEAFSQ